MIKRVYTLVDLAEEFGKDKQFIRRQIMGLNLEAINKDSREHLNETLKYSHHVYIELSKALGLSTGKNSDTHDTQNDTQNDTHDMQKDGDNLSKDKLIEILERELRHSKDKLEKAESEKENLMRLLDQQQRLSLQANQKIELLEHKETEEKVGEKRKWWEIFK